MRKIASLLLFISAVISTRCIAQNDSATFAAASWETQSIAKGITWKHFHFDNKTLFAANENINYIEISPKAKKYRVHVVHSDSLETTSTLAKRTNALAAINGSFFKMRGPDPDNSKTVEGKPKLERSLTDHNRSVVYLRENGILIADNPRDKNNVRKRNQQGSIAVDHGRVSLFRDSADLDWEKSIPGEDVLSTGPVLITAGEMEAIGKDAFNTDRHPRTAIGTKPDGTVIMLVVDGRAAESQGMTILELQTVFRWLGCSDAVNLDGGGSTAMYIRGQPDDGVVSYPSDNKIYDHKGEREVANALVIIRR